MQWLWERLPWRGSPKPNATSLDLGGGRSLAPEDVLDGHSARLLSERRAGIRTVPIHVEDELTAAITVMAPELAPLADLAEEVAVAVPAVSPEPTFRQNLYDALERTHRQHLMQEALGTRSAPESGTPWKLIALLAVTALLILITATGWITMRRLRKPSAPRTFI